MLKFEVHTLKGHKNKRCSWNSLLWKTCQCSYCTGDSKLHYGLNIPKNKAWNSWWIIKIWKYTYIRFTLHFLKYFKRRR